MQFRFAIVAVATAALLSASPVFATGHGSSHSSSAGVSSHSHSSGSHTSTRSASSKAHAPAKTKSSSSTGHATSATKSAKQESATSARASRCASCNRDAHGRIQRSAEAKDAFKRETGYPHGRPGYVIDHITPLACGGADAPSNMQWQTIEAAKAKDRVERKGCGK